jgi:trehalose synthase
MREVPIRPAPLEPYLKVLGDERMARLRVAAGRVRQLLGGRTVWHLNSTAAGGGVAELLYSLGPLTRAAGLDARWLVIDGDSELFTITKRLCMRLYGSAGDGGPLGAAELRHFRHVSDANARQLTSRIRPGDIVIVHDPQPAGLIEAAQGRGAMVVWRCHIGSDEPNRHTRDGWAFLRRFVERADATVFSTQRHVPGWAPRPRVIRPSIDPCSPRNAALSDEETISVLRGIGILDDVSALPVTVPVPIGPAVVVRQRAVVMRDGPPPPATVPMVVQVSRWDRLKDMSGVLHAFAAAGDADCYLTLAGPDVSGVADDPEAAAVFDDCRRQWAALPRSHRSRSQLVCLPMSDLRENSVMVNALQRHAAVIVQKSLAEGFGLTAAEAMWKSRPLLVSAVGGLRDQVVDGEHGLLLADPGDIPAAAEGIRRLLADRQLAARLGANARRRAAEWFLPDRHLLDWAQLIEEIVPAAVT